jgi:hypothetical protein
MSHHSHLLIKKIKEAKQEEQKEAPAPVKSPAKKKAPAKPRAKTTRKKATKSE